jgi:hypothetical protein
MKEKKNVRKRIRKEQEIFFTTPRDIPEGM